MTEAALVASGGNFADIDAGDFNGENFAYVAAFGMFTNVSYETNQNVKNVLGAGAYLIDILRSMDLINFKNSTSHITLKFNEETIEDDFIFGVVGNTYSVAGLSTLVPSDASMDDGLLDGMFIKVPKTLAELEKIKMALINPKYPCANIITAKSKRFEVVSSEKISWTLDGEFGGSVESAEIGIIPSAFRIAVPVL